MSYGILGDDAGRNRISQDLREADFQDSLGNHEFAAHLREQVDELRRLDDAICHVQVVAAGLLPQHDAENCGICTNDGECD